MSNIKRYKNKQGDKRYKFQLYAGTDPQTGKPKHLTRSGFTTQKKATLAIAQLKVAISNGGLDVIKNPNNITFEEVYKQWYEYYVNTRSRINLLSC